MGNQHWIDRDLKVLWHPCTQMKDHETLPLIPIKSGRGVYVEDFEGRRYIDAISSWWVNLFGHCHPVINAAIKNQIETLEHIILAGFSHQPVIELSEKLINLSPDGLARCFYTDNGSSAVEVALKMSFHYWQNVGQRNKTRFIALSNSYHGETLAALSVGDIPLYTDTYKPLLLDVLKAPSPDCYQREPGETWEACSRRQFESMRRLLEKNHDSVAAVIVEPLVQCAGQMRMYHPIYLKLLREACDEFQVHLIADEIAVGFGRTGTLFGVNQAGITPDFMCLSKGLTAGYLPLAVVLTTENMYQAFYGDYTALKAFLHSHSYTGNPLACTAALTTIELFENNHVLESNVALMNAMRESTAHLVDHPHVAEVRQTGMIQAIEIVADKASRQPYAWQARKGLEVYRYALEHGVMLRPLGNVIYMMPPYVITPDEIARIAQVATDAIHKVTSS